MTQFVRGELISIDELEQAADLEPAWHKLLKMCEELSEYGIPSRFRPHRRSGSELFAAATTKSQTGRHWISASQSGNGVRFSVEIVAKVLWDMPIVAKHVSNTNTQQSTVKMLTF